MNTVIFIVFVVLSIINVLLMAMLVAMIVVMARKTHTLNMEKEALKEGVSAVEEIRLQEVDTLQKFLRGDFSDLDLPDMKKATPAGYDRPADRHHTDL